MSSVIICDKCGMSCGNTSKFRHIRSHKLVNADSFSANCEKHMDVCLECYDKIFKDKEDQK